MEKTIKNFEVVNLMNMGLGHCTALTLEPAHAYKVGKFRRTVLAAFESIQEAQKAILKDVGIEDPQSFDKEANELFSIENPTSEQKAQIEAKKKVYSDFNAQVGELYAEDAKLEGIKTIPFEQWQLLRKENAEKEIGNKKVEIFSNYTEDLLLGILWEEPTE